MFTAQQTLTSHHPSPTSASADQTASVRLEPFGTELQKDAQDRIHRARERIRSSQGITSFGRSIAAFTDIYADNSITTLVQDFRRVLLIGQTQHLARLTNTVRCSSASVSESMPVVAASERDFLPRAVARLENSQLPFALNCKVLRSDARHNDIRSIQELNRLVGLTPLPGAFLRGHHGNVVTLVLTDKAGRLAASATVVGLGNVGANYSDTAILVGVSVAPEVQGNGLGSHLTAGSLLAARNLLGARKVIAVVHPANEVALRTNASLGLQPRSGFVARYVEHSGSC